MDLMNLKRVSSNFNSIINNNDELWKTPSENLETNYTDNYFGNVTILINFVCFIYLFVIYLFVNL